MSRSAPATRPPTAESRKGTRNHVGRGAARSPGFAALARFAWFAARSTPNTIRKMGATLAPNTVQPTTARELDDRGRYRL